MTSLSVPGATSSHFPFRVPQPVIDLLPDVIRTTGEGLSQNQLKMPGSQEVLLVTDIHCGRKGQFSSGMQDLRDSSYSRWSYTIAPMTMHIRTAMEPMGSVCV